MLGFYTLSASSVDRQHLPPALSAKAPRYAQAPAVLLGRLAVSVTHQRRDLGRILLADAFKRAVDSDIGAYAMLVEPKSERARAFYLACGFLPFEADLPLLFMPLAMAGQILGR